MSSEQGVQQGDPLVPLFFTLTWHKVVRALLTGLKIHSWYLDDGHLVGDPQTLNEAIRCIESEGAKLGVTLNVQKCKIWGPGILSDVPSKNTLHEVSVGEWAPDHGLKVLWLPVEYPDSLGFNRRCLADLV